MRRIQLGIKVTHDAAVAAIDIDSGALLFSVEIEKLHNNPRYSKLHKFQQVDEVLMAQGVKFNEIFGVAVDGWRGGHVTVDGEKLSVASYHEAEHLSSMGTFDVTTSPWGETVPLLGCTFPYLSFTHNATHIAAAVALRGGDEQELWVVTWDGGQPPTLNRCKPGSAELVGLLHRVSGSLYAVMGCYWGPYANRRQALAWDHKADGLLIRGFDVPGKLMSYIALSTHPNRVRAAQSAAHRIYKALRLAVHWRPDPLHTLEHQLCAALAVAPEAEHCSDADMLLAVHNFLQDLLVDGAVRMIPRNAHLIFTGGSALNIKWNTALRDSGHFGSVFVPPVPNDSGNAIGAAVLGAAALTGEWRPMKWSVYCGPRILHDTTQRAGWGNDLCDAKGLAHILALNPARPVLVLRDAAEIGPRSLGHRSLLMSAGPEAKATLNRIKQREDFRPVAPICLEEHAAEFFTPGTPDPWMLFEHRARSEWVKERLPSAFHLDGTARLQTVNAEQCPFTHEVLTHYRHLRGVPVLCNTSANLNGSGFFHSLQSALVWAEKAGVDFVLCNDTLFWRAI